MINRKLMLPALISVVFIAGCGNDQAPKNKAFVPLVSAQSAELINYQPIQTFVGRTEAVEDVGIVPQVSGYLKMRYFKEGQLVQKGQLLYKIDPSLYEAKVASAQAAVSQAKAGLHNANLDYERGQDLLPRGGISQSEFDRLTAVKLQAEAGVKSADAQLLAAELDLSHTTIVAPFTGRISKSNASLGDLVSPSTGVLTTIVSLDPMQASFSMSEKQRLEMGADMVSGSGKGRGGLVEVYLRLGKGYDYEHVGNIDYLGNRIDVKTGTIGLRASFPNPEHRLLPGQYVDVIVKDKKSQLSIIIPRLAVQTDLEGDFIMVLKEGNKVERRNVILGEQTDKGIIIREGLNENERVLTKGLQRVRNGMTVRLQGEGA
ncbi:efflux RND transporter periplasmic adaptor subunit [Enterovibrio nigricans]|uniref:Membrane fusion protein, multidrug efflux system n=1 Tax=Enterovibrio nigricans DSM 22720 TaxID=1121868 RepID=A0A1T4VU44_9GAMM|nr:efflux RND transporter periplasmic adaptor subunit [Enterovibrio nigricans]PKF49409.1 efflux RND transporter periplasmic adaptor subunit [Enterovibrio nigricans]SKA68520.1 membrane fusion protein, multidrug efflux system [Enterovibrio nigricans DSM 22720]